VPAKPDPGDPGAGNYSAGKLPKGATVNDKVRRAAKVAGAARYNAKKDKYDPKKK